MGGSGDGGRTASGGVASGGATGAAGVAGFGVEAGAGSVIGAGGDSSVGGRGGSVQGGRSGAGEGSGGSAGAIGGKLTYQTTFDAPENPLLEGGAWRHTDSNQAFVRTANGLAFGTQVGSEWASSNYNDSNAFLSGFPPDQRASAVIHRTSAMIAGNLEVELLLRWSEGAERSTSYGPTRQYGYEINIGQGIYGTFVQIGRWKDANLFDSKTASSPLATMGLHDGDVFSAQIVGSVITAWLNDTVIATATDSTYATGNPGIGFFRHDEGGTIDPESHCFKSFTAEGL
jgi:hypothetical protein